MSPERGVSLAVAAGLQQRTGQNPGPEAGANQEADRALDPGLLIPESLVLEVRLVTDLDQGPSLNLNPGPGAAAEADPDPDPSLEAGPSLDLGLNLGAGLNLAAAANPGAGHGLGAAGEAGLAADQCRDQDQGPEVNLDQDLTVMWRPRRRK